MAFDTPETITPREYTYLEADKETNRLNREHLVRMKQLEIQLEMAKSSSEIELRKLEAKWASWLSIPKTIIKLPVLFVFGIAYCIYAAKNKRPPKEFWDFINR